MSKLILDRINKQKLLDTSSKKIKESLLKKYDETLDSKFLIHKKILSYEPSKILIILFVLLIFGIPFFILKLFLLKKFQEEVGRKIDIYTIHKNFFENTPISGKVVKIKNSKKIKKLNDEGRRKFGIPKFAWVEKEHPGFELKTNIGKIQYISILWAWEVRSDKSKHVVYKNVTNAIFMPKIDKDFHVFNFIATNIKSIFLNNKKFEKIKLESPEFNKKIKVFSDNKLKIRLIYTPYFMEKVLEQNKLIKNKIKNWELEKNNEYYLLSYSPKDKNHLFVNTKTLSFNKNKIIDGLVEDIYEDFYDFYSTLQIMLFTNLFKF